MLTAHFSAPSRLQPPRSSLDPRDTRREWICGLWAASWVSEGLPLPLLVAGAADVVCARWLAVVHEVRSPAKRASGCWVPSLNPAHHRSMPHEDRQPSVHLTPFNLVYLQEK